MAETKIEWADFTFNPWVGCQKVSPGCDRCYAEGWAKRSGQVQWGPHAARRRTSLENWRKPLRWATQASDRLIGTGRPRVFCASLADVFDNQVPEAWRHDLWMLIGQTAELDWLLLTKRPENVEKMLPYSWRTTGEPYPNVWLGFTAEDQEHFDRRWKIMREIPATVRFCSYEPAIGPLRLYKSTPPLYTEGLDWLICGGESGHGHREMDQQWEEDIRLDCAEAGVAYFFKQRSGKLPIDPGYPLVRQFPRAA